MKREFVAESRVLAFGCPFTLFDPLGYGGIELVGVHGYAGELADGGKLLVLAGRAAKPVASKWLRYSTMAARVNAIACVRTALQCCCTLVCSSDSLGFLH
jgi:hypothetical protein